MKTQDVSLKKDFYVYALGRFGSKFIAILLLPVITRYLSKADFGFMDMVNTTLNLLIPIITLRVSDSVYRFEIAESDLSKKRIIFSSAFVFLIMSMSIFTILYIVVTSIVEIRYNLIILVLFLLTIIRIYLTNCLRGIRKNKEFSIGFVIQAISMGISALYFLIYLKLGLVGFILSTILGELLVVVYTVKHCEFKNYFCARDFSKSKLNEMIKYSLPLIFGGIAWWIVNVSDRCIILYYMDMDSVGTYAIANKFTLFFVMFNQVFYMAWQNKLLSHKGDIVTEKRLVVSMFKKLMFVSAVLFMLMFFGKNIIFNLLIDQKFVGALKYVDGLVIGSIFMIFTSFIEVPFLRHKDTKRMFISVMVAAVINISINFLLIRKMGLSAAVISTIVAFMVAFFIRLFQVKKRFYGNVIPWYLNNKME